MNTQNHKSNMVDNRMAGELFELLLPYNHINIIAHLSIKDVFAQKHFVHHWLSKSYWMDTRKCYKQRHKNSQQIFEIFGTFNEEEPSQVQENVVKIIYQDKDLHSSVGQHHLRRSKLNIDEWIKLMSSDSVFGDELMLYALSRIYHRHVVIFTAHGYWTTVGSDEPLSPMRLLEICEVRLMYIGTHMYSELKLKPFVLVQLPAVTESPCRIILHSVENNTDIVKAMELTTGTAKQSSCTVTADDETEGMDGSECSEGSESDTPMDECNSTDTADKRNFHPSSEDSDYSNTPSESLLTPGIVSNFCNIPGINNSANDLESDLTHMVENCVIGKNLSGDSDDDHVENAENTVMGKNVMSNVNISINSREKAVICKNVDDAVLNIDEITNVMSINSENTTMGKNVISNINVGVNSCEKP